MCKVLPVHGQQEVERSGEPLSTEGGQGDTAHPGAPQQCEQQLLSPMESSVLTVPTYQTYFIATTQRKRAQMLSNTDKRFL